MLNLKIKKMNTTSYKKDINEMNITELRLERHHIAAKISYNKKKGNDVTEMKEYEAEVVRLIAEMKAELKAMKEAETADVETEDEIEDVTEDVENETDDEM